MWMNPEDARTDAILAGAVTLFGGFAVGLLAQVPLYPGGLVGIFLGIAWLFVLTGLVPQLLTRYRELGPESYGLEGDHDGWRSGLLLALPVVVAGTVRGMTQLDASPLAALLGRLSTSSGGGPAILGGPGGVEPLEIVIQALTWVALGAGTVLLFTFLTVRGRDAFARHDMSATEVIRTFGVGAVAATLVFGSLLAVATDAITFTSVVINTLALLSLVLVADRLVPAGAQTTRGAILAPVVLAALLHLLGSRSSTLLLNLYGAALAAGIAVVIAAVLEGRLHARAVLPLAAAVALYPSCLSPLAFGLGGLPC